MSTFLRAAIVTSIFVLAGQLAWGQATEKQSPDKRSPETQPPQTSPNSAADKAANEQQPAEEPKPKPISPQILKGISYLVAQQHADGGWGQGGGWRSGGTKGGRVEGKDVQDPCDVGNTAMALLVLLRAGNTPEKGQYAKQFAKGLSFLYQHVESADKDSLFVTDVRDTQLQTKIGPYVDTFAATWLMSELKGSLAQPPARLLAALDKTVGKIEHNQKADGTFGGNHAWAAVLSQGLCAVALNSAAQNGVAVKQQTLQRDFQLATNGVDVKTGKFDMAAAAPTTTLATSGTSSISTYSGGTVVVSGEVLATDSAPVFAAPGLGAALGGTSRAGRAAGSRTSSNAGVELYQLSVQCATLNFNLATSAPERKQADETLSSPTSTDEQKRLAKSTIKRLDSQKAVAGAAAKAVTDKLGDKRFTAGFGNNGGEEFLSYMNISLALRVKGGAEWQKWDRQVTENLLRVQNSDGDWSGDHCITGRTFCTAAALLTMLVDRAPLGSPSGPLAEKR